MLSTVRAHRKHLVNVSYYHFYGYSIIWFNILECLCVGPQAYRKRNEYSSVHRLRLGQTCTMRYLKLPGCSYLQRKKFYWAPPWLMPVILATQEAEIRRITVRSQPGQIIQENLSRKTHHKNKSGWVAQGEGPEFKLQYRKKKKKKKKKEITYNT
jgi:hypothetical protein